MISVLRKEIIRQSDADPVDLQVTPLAIGYEHLIFLSGVLNLRALAVAIASPSTHEIIEEIELRGGW